MAIATAGLMSLPIIGTAQSYPPSGSGSGQSGSGQQTGTSSSYGAQTEQNTPQWHLDQAKKDLDSISTTSLTGEAANHVSQIKTQFNSLYNDYTKSRGGASSASGGSSSTGGQVGATGTQQGSTVTPPTGTSGSEASSYAAGDWKTSYRQISQMLDRLNIPASSSKGMGAGMGGSGTSGTSSGTSGTSGGSGTTGTTSGGTTGTTTSSQTSSSATPTLDADVRAKLADFRMHLDQFYQLAAAGAPMASADPYSSSSGNGSTSSVGGPQQPGTSGQSSSDQSAVGTRGSSSTAEASRYLDDIENIVNQALNAGPSAGASSQSGSSAYGTSGQSSSAGSTSQKSSSSSSKKVTISREQLEQIKQDVEKLRQHLGSSGK